MWELRSPMSGVGVGANLNLLEKAVPESDFAEPMTIPSDLKGDACSMDYNMKRLGPRVTKEDSLNKDGSIKRRRPGMIEVNVGQLLATQFAKESIGVTKTCRKAASTNADEAVVEGSDDETADAVTSAPTCAVAPLDKVVEALKIAAVTPIVPMPEEARNVTMLKREIIAIGKQCLGLPEEEELELHPEHG